MSVLDLHWKIGSLTILGLQSTEKGLDAPPVHGWQYFNGSVWLYDSELTVTGKKIIRGNALAGCLKTANRT